MVLDVEEGIITGRKGVSYRLTRYLTTMLANEIHLCVSILQSSGVILVKTNTLVVVAVYHSPIQPMQAKVNLEHFAEDMKEKGR